MASRKVEIFSAGCSVCNDTVELVKRISCPSCEVTVLNMNDQKVAHRAKSLGIWSVPAVVVNGKLSSCCVGRGPDEAALRAAGVGQPL
jgi:glutaredoxin 3